MIPDFYKHQLVSADFFASNPRTFDMSDPGTAKTRPHIHDFLERRKRGGKKGIVFAPKSIVQLAWGDDTDKFFPGAQYVTAYAENRKRAFETDADLYITNHDAIKWLFPTNKAKRPFPNSFWDQFDTLLVDESSAYKHASSARSKCLRNFAERLEFIRLLSGTPNSNTILDIWHQAFLLDRGARLGDSFWKFRLAVCEPKQVGPLPQHIKWTDMPGAETVVYDMIRDISIRHRLEECIDIPPNHQWNMDFDLDPKVRKAYDEMISTATMMLESGQVITSVHASALNQKLLQIAAGAVYTGITPGDYVEISTERAELILDLVEQRKHTLVVFNWHHQRDQLLRLAKKRGISHFLIDGTVSDRKRIDAVRDYQAGNLQTGFVHPQSAGHGLTMTRGTGTIMASPTYNAEHYKQVFHRIYRASQTQKTETIHVRGRNTIDVSVYEGTLGPKLDSMALFLSLIEQAKNDR